MRLFLGGLFVWSCSCGDKQSCAAVAAVKRGLQKNSRYGLSSYSIGVEKIRRGLVKLR